MTSEQSTREFFVEGVSGPAPFVPDTVYRYVTASDPVDAAHRFDEAHNHPAGWTAIIVYANADAMHKRQKPLLESR